VKKIIFIFCIFILTSCAAVNSSDTTESSNNQSKSSLSDPNKDIETSQAKLLGDMPFPSGSIMHNDAFILGNGNSWVGRINVTTNLNVLQSFAFFRDEFPKSGWILLSSVASERSILLFHKADRSITIEIQAPIMSMNSKSLITLTVGPKSFKSN
jgi:hypothetical protein